MDVKKTTDQVGNPIPINKDMTREVVDKEVDRPITFTTIIEKSNYNIIYLTDCINKLNDIINIYGGRTIDSIELNSSSPTNVLNEFNVNSTITENLLVQLNELINNLKDIIK